MEAILIGYNLQKFIDGLHTAPITIITMNNEIKQNLEHQTWLRQDKLLFGALVGTLSPSLVPLITQPQTSHEAWQILDVCGTNTRSYQANKRVIQTNIKGLSNDLRLYASNQDTG